MNSKKETQWKPVNMVNNGSKKFGHNKKMTVFTGVSFQVNVWSFLQEAKESGRNNEMTVLPRWP